MGRVMTMITIKATINEIIRLNNNNNNINNNNNNENHNSRPINKNKSITMLWRTLNSIVGHIEPYFNVPLF